MTKSDDYVLGRALSASLRLDAQHLLWRLHTGYVLHPEIPITDNMKIAEIGTGTGIWLFDLANELPPTAQLHGFDISEDQYPPEQFRPPNVKLGVLNSLLNPPPSLVEQYDIVHIRMWASNVQPRHVHALIHHIKQILKPGGYVQWEEADLTNQVVRGPGAQELEKRLNTVFQRSTLDYSWVSVIPRHLKEQNMQLLQHRTDVFPPPLVQKCTDTYLLALSEILQGIKRSCSKDLLPQLEEAETALEELCAYHNKGLVYNWGPIRILARRLD